MKVGEEIGPLPSVVIVWPVTQSKKTSVGIPETWCGGGGGRVWVGVCGCVYFEEIGQGFFFLAHLEWERRETHLFVVFLEGRNISVRRHKHQFEVFALLFQCCVLLTQLWGKSAARRTPVSGEVQPNDRLGGKRSSRAIW